LIIYLDNIFDNIFDIYITKENHNIPINIKDILILILTLRLIKSFLPLQFSIYSILILKIFYYIFEIYVYIYIKDKHNL